MRALVTGGAGFIGSTLVDRLLAEGHTVDVVDDLSTGDLGNLADARRDGARAMTFHRLDVRSPDLLTLVGRRRPEVVFHLAGRHDVAASVADPRQDADLTVLGALGVLEAARASGARKVVVAVDGLALYGELAPRDLPLKEAQPHRPTSPHGVSVGAVCDHLRVHRELHQLESTVLALAHVYGPRQDPAAPGGVVAAFAAALLAGTPCTVHGTGEQTRDLVFVDDVVDALVRAAERGGGLVLNVGTGIETSVRDLHRTLVAAAPPAVPPVLVSGPARPRDLARAALDPGRAAIHLGWRPWTDLPTGCRAVLAARGAPG